jgi:hypothetical protein
LIARLELAGSSWSSFMGRLGSMGKCSSIQEIMTFYPNLTCELICGGKDTRILARKVFEVGSYHFGHELFERDPVLPAEL